MLDLQSAIKEIRGSDPRPLLVIRDCDLCNGKDDALLSRTLNNDRTLLGTHWFHCIKIDRRVIEKSHPFFPLFNQTERRPHLFLSSWDGSLYLPLPGTQSPREVWLAMAKVLKNDYKKSATLAVKSWLRLLYRFDTLDSRILGLREQIELLGPKSRKNKLKRLEAKLAKLEGDHEDALAEEKQIMNLVLRRAPKFKTVADFDAEAAAGVSAKGGKSLLERIRKDQKKEDLKDGRPPDK